MRHGSSSRRSRNRGNSGRRGNQNRVQVFDSNGPDVRIRGTAHQIHEKYIALAKDAAASGDTVLSESYLQHAEHYQRIITSWDETIRNGGRAPVEKTVEDTVSEDEGADNDGEDLGLPASLVGTPEKKTAVKEDVLEDA